MALIGILLAHVSPPHPTPAPRGHTGLPHPHTGTPTSSGHDGLQSWDSPLRLPFHSPLTMGAPPLDPLAAIAGMPGIAPADRAARSEMGLHGSHGSRAW